MNIVSATALEVRHPERATVHIASTEHALLIGPEASPLIRVDWDGSVTYGRDYTPDAASRELWDAVGLALDGYTSSLRE